MLPLPEELLLLATHDDKGTTPNLAEMTLGYGMAGAVLLELALRNKIQVKDKFLLVKDESPLDEPPLDEALQKILNAPKPQKVQEWVTQLNTPLNSIQETVYQRLVRKHIVREEERRVLFFFRVKRYPINRKKIRNEIQKRIHATVLRKLDFDLRTRCLLSLIHVCGWSRLLFERDRLKEAKIRLKEIVTTDLSAELEILPKMGYSPTQKQDIAEIIGILLTTPMTARSAH